MSRYFRTTWAFIRYQKDNAYYFSFSLWSHFDKSNVFLQYVIEFCSRV